MRRLASSSVAPFMAAAATATAVVPARTIYTTWGSVPLEPWAEKESWLTRLTSPSTYRSFEFWHVPEVSVPDALNMTAVERYLLSCIEDDTQRLLNIGWCYDFDPFWHDRVNSLDTLYQALYLNKFPIYKFLLGNCANKEAEKRHIEKKLNYLKSVLHWAAMTERRFTAITKSRYYVQRRVWNALERERYLCAAVELVDSFAEKVPEEFKEKALSELEVHLVNLRHWVYDCPNGKRTFTRRLA